MEGEGRAVTRDFKHSFKAPERAELPLVVYNARFQQCRTGSGLSGAAGGAGILSGG